MHRLEKRYARLSRSIQHAADETRGRRGEEVAKGEERRGRRRRGGRRRGGRRRGSRQLRKRERNRR
jgi:hypothetical protein